MKAAIVRINELIATALIFGVVIGLAARLSSIDTHTVGAEEAGSAAYYLSHIPRYLSHSILPSSGYGAI